jgi:hypothetical protein
MRELISVAHFLWPIHIHHKLKMSGKVRFSRVLAVIGRHAAGLKWPPPVCLPTASLDCLKARAAPTHPRAQPEHLGGVPWPQELASG